MIGGGTMKRERVSDERERERVVVESERSGRFSSLLYVFTG
jgi:hypothetical protein